LDAYLPLIVEIRKVRAQNPSCTLFSASSPTQQLLADEKQATQTYRLGKHKDEKTGNVKSVGVLKCSYGVKFPSTYRAQFIPFLTCFFNQRQT